MATLVPLRPLPNQTVQAQLGGQACTINVYQLEYGLFVDLFVAQQAIIVGVIAENYNRIVRSLYLGFSGDLVFVDTQGAADPVYTGLGSRYLLAYVPADELPAGQG